jgi:hypothetical protein
MSDLYDLQANVADKASSARECSVCHGTAKPTSAVWLEKAGVIICQDCAHDLAESVTPKPQTIPTTPVRKSTVTPTEAYVPFEQHRTAELIKAEMYELLLAEGLRQAR